MAEITRDLKSISRNEAREIQRTLKASGYDIGKTGVDGKIGKNTLRAIEEFKNYNPEEFSRQLGTSLGVITGNVPAPQLKELPPTLVTEKPMSFAADIEGAPEEVYYGSEKLTDSSTQQSPTEVVPENQQDNTKPQKNTKVKKQGAKPSTKKVEEREDYPITKPRPGYEFLDEKGQVTDSRTALFEVPITRANSDGTISYGNRRYSREAFAKNLKSREAARPLKDITTNQEDSLLQRQRAVLNTPYQKVAVTTPTVAVRNNTTRKPIVRHTENTVIRPPKTPRPVAQRGIEDRTQIGQMDRNNPKVVWTEGGWKK